MPDVLDVLKVQVTKYNVLRVAVALRRNDFPTVGAFCVALAVALDRTMCDRNAHDPTTLQDVCVLHRVIPIEQDGKL